VYVPPAFALTDEQSRDVIRRISFGTLVMHGEAGYEIAPLPWLLEGDRLIGHVAKANPIWKHPDGQEVVVIFTGTHGYISPGWYATKAETGKVVPTWNYSTVAVHGTLTAQHDDAAKRQIIEALTIHHEPTVGGDWQVTDAPGDYIDGLVNAIVGVELTIIKIEGKAKLSQNRPEADQLGVRRHRPDLLPDSLPG
jgi:transcriptional regulator